MLWKTDSVVGILNWVIAFVEVPINLKFVFKMRLYHDILKNRALFAGGSPYILAWSQNSST